jgi:hypothetical protein
MSDFKVGTHLSATVIPFLPDCRIDEEGLRVLLNYLCTPDKISGVVLFSMPTLGRWTP